MNPRAPSPFQQHIDQLLEGKTMVPLAGMEANRQAYRLRMKGLSFEAVSRIMRSYHGVSKSANAWRMTCRAQGAPPMAVRGKVPRNRWQRQEKTA